MRNINIVGSSGSGKSTFGRQLAAARNLRYIEMDLLYWRPAWQEPSDPEFFADLTAALSTDGWVLDGNYNRTRTIKWAKADTLIWLDYSFARTIYQVIARSVKRIFTNQELWPGTGNKETFRKAFLSRKSIILWSLTHYYANRKRYLSLKNDPGGLRFVHIRNPKQANEFIAANKIQN